MSDTAVQWLLQRCQPQMIWFKKLVMTKRMLIAYSMASTHVSTTLDYLLMIQEHLGFEVDFVHATHDSFLDFDIDDYDVVFNSYCVRHCFEGYVSENYRNALKSFNGLKVIAVQDEYDHTNKLKAAIRELDFDLVLTCVPQSSLNYVYPRHEFPDVEFVTVFTGYVSEQLVAARPNPKPLADRSKFIGYRGRDIGGRYGQLGFDKYEIGRRTRQACNDRGIITDIAMDEQSRIYGPDWFDFIEDCRAMLGSESGSNIFDFDGSIEAQYKELTQANNGNPPSYEEFAPYVTEREGEIDMGQISPRVFECATLRTPMVLYRGRYSDAIEPDTHYIPLEKDFSNIDEVLESLKDDAALEEMADRAYQHLVASGIFTYQAFCERIHMAMVSQMEAKQMRLAVSETAGGEGAAQAPQPAACIRKTVVIQTKMTTKDKLLSEKPTKSPKTLDDFQKKQIKLANALATEAMTQFSKLPGSAMRNLAAASVAVALGSQRARYVWRLLPMSIRTKLRSRINSRLMR